MAGQDQKKNLILGVVAVVLLGAAGVLIYRSLAGGGEPVPAPIDSSVTEKLDEVQPTVDNAEPAPRGSGRLSHQ